MSEEFKPIYLPNPQVIQATSEILGELIEFDPLGAQNEGEELRETAQELLERLWKAGWEVGIAGGFGRRSGQV